MKRGASAYMYMYGRTTDELRSRIRLADLILIDGLMSTRPLLALLNGWVTNVISVTLSFFHVGISTFLRHPRPDPRILRTSPTVQQAYWLLPQNSRNSDHRIDKNLTRQTDAGKTASVIAGLTIRLPAIIIHTRAAATCSCRV